MVVRELKTANEFYDLVSSIPGGTFVTYAYVTAAKISYPTKKAKDPKTNKIKTVIDYNTLTKMLGYKSLVTGIIKITRYHIPYGTPNSMEKNYEKYLTDFNELRKRYGIPHTERIEGYKGRVRYGKNGVYVYKGDNEEKVGNSYSAQNIRNAKSIVKHYYLVGINGKILEEVDEEFLKGMFLPKPILSGVKHLKDNGADRQTIRNYIDEHQKLNFDYRCFEGKSILYMVGTCKNINGEKEKFYYSNNRLSDTINGIKIDKNDVLKVTNELWKYDIENETNVNESKTKKKFWL